MAIVGASVVVAVSMPFGSMGSSETDRTWQTLVGPDTSAKHDLPTTPVGNAAVRFSWNSTHAAEVYWFAAGPCAQVAGWCLEGGPLANWTGNTTGHWTGSGAPASAYCVLVEDPTSAPVNFSGELVESYSNAPHHLPMIPLVLIVGGGALLVGIGGLAIYLGLFLPSGIYQTPAPDDEGEDSPYDPPP